jgi:spore germination protein KC
MGAGSKSKSKIKSAILAALLLVVAVGSGGCWDRREIESLGFINAVGVDKAGDGGVLVTFYVVNPDAVKKGGGGGGGGPPAGGPPAANVTSIAARNVSEATAKFAEESPRLPRFKQIDAIIIGEDLARQGVGPTLDFFSRHWEMRRSIWILAAKGKARDILAKGQFPPEKLLSSGIKTVMERTDHLTATRYPVVLGDFLSDIGRPGMEPIAASIEIHPMQENVPQAAPGAGARGSRGGEGQAGGDGGGSGSGSGAGSGAGENNTLAFKGAGVFRGDRLLDFLGTDETRGVLWVQGKVSGGRISVPLPGPGAPPSGQGATSSGPGAPPSGQGATSSGPGTPPHGQDWASLAIERESTQVTPVVENNKIRFLIKIHESGYV